jgi:hypothetical protein
VGSIPIARSMRLVQGGSAVPLGPPYAKLPSVTGWAWQSLGGRQSEDRRMTHKFRIGQLVRLVRSAFPGQPVGGVYEIVRLMPESNG